MVRSMQGLNLRLIKYDRIRNTTLNANKYTYISEEPNAVNVSYFTLAPEQIVKELYSVTHITLIALFGAKIRQK